MNNRSGRGGAQAGGSASGGATRKNSLASRGGRGGAQPVPSRPKDSYRPQRDNITRPDKPANSSVEVKSSNNSDDDRIRQLERDLAARERHIRLLELEKQYREAGERERQLLKERAAFEKLVVGKVGAEHAKSPDKAPALASSTTSAQPAVLASRGPHAGNLNGIQPRGVKRPPTSPASRQDRDAPAQFGSVVPGSLDYDGFNDEASRYGAGKRVRVAADLGRPIEVDATAGAARDLLPSTFDDRSSAVATPGKDEAKPVNGDGEESSRTAFSGAGGEPAVPMSSAPSLVSPAFRTSTVNKIVLNRRLEQLRAQQIWPAPPKAPGSGGRPSDYSLRTIDARPDVLPEGVIPGLTPGWEKYVKVIYGSNGT